MFSTYFANHSIQWTEYAWRVKAEQSTVCIADLFATWYVFCESILVSQASKYIAMCSDADKKQAACP